MLRLLKRALKLAASAQQQAASTGRTAGLAAAVWLYVDILNEYAFYLREGAPDITPHILRVHCLPPVPGSASINVQSRPGRIRSHSDERTTAASSAWASPALHQI